MSLAIVLVLALSQTRTALNRVCASPFGSQSVPKPPRPSQVSREESSHALAEP